jgi:uncharacterized protein (TIGR02599 family)
MFLQPMKNPPPAPPAPAAPCCAAGARRDGFTLTEMLVSVSLLVLLALVLAQMTTFTMRMSRRISGEASVFQDASLAFETMTRKISQATLNPIYYD